MNNKVKLQDYIQIQNGYAFKSNLFQNFGIPVVRITNVENGKLNLDKVVYYSEDKKLDKFIIKKDDILLSLTGDDKTLKVCINDNDKKIYLNQRVAILRSKESLIQKYLYYSIKKYSSLILEKAKGIAQKNISVDDINSVEIPLPSIEKQNQIAKTLDKANELIELRRESITKLDALAKSIFIDMFGDPVDNPMNWDITTMKDLNVILEGGKNIAQSSNDKNIKNYILKISAVTSGEFNSNEIKPLPNDYNVPKNHFIKRGDLLMSRANTSLLVGSTAYIKESYDNLVLPDKIWRFVFPENVKLNKIFYWKLAQTKSIRNEISNRATGTSGSMKNISKPKALSIPIIYPPLELQNKFARIIEKIEEQKSLYEKELELLQNNFDALLQKSFQE
jgi:type I restriction enzyme S subunit